MYSCQEDGKRIDSCRFFRSFFVLDSFQIHHPCLSTQFTEGTYSTTLFNSIHPNNEPIPIQFRFSDKTAGFNSFGFIFEESSWNRFVSLNRAVQVCLMVYMPMCPKKLLIISTPNVYIISCLHNILPYRIGKCGIEQNLVF